MSRIYDAGDYRQMFNGQYVHYIWDSYRKLQKIIPKGTKSILSIGCGTGDVEALMPFDFCLYDPFSPFEKYRVKPSGQYDIAIAHGCVMSCAQPEEKRPMVELALGHASTFFVHIGYQKNTHSDACMSYFAWDEKEVFSGYQWRWVNKSYIEVRHKN